MTFEALMICASVVRSSRPASSWSLKTYRVPKTDIGCLFCYKAHTQKVQRRPALSLPEG